MTVTEVSDRLYGAPIKRTEPVRLPGLAAPYGRTAILPQRRWAPQPWELMGRGQGLTGTGQGLTGTGQELVGRGQEVAVIRGLVDDLAASGEVDQVPGRHLRPDAIGEHLVDHLGTDPDEPASDIVERAEVLRYGHPADRV